VNLTDALRGLRVDDVQRARAEIHVLPSQGQRLADPEATAGEDLEQDTAEPVSAFE
jgi:hypothetical protein